MATRRSSYDLPVERDLELETVTGSLLGDSRISWAAIFAGVAIALAVQLLLAVAGVAAGLMALPGTDDAGSLGMAALGWWGGSAAISLLIGAFAAGVLSGCYRTVDGVLHGLGVWATGLLIAVILTTSGVSSVVGTTFRALGSVAGGVTQVAGQALGQAAGSVGANLDPNEIFNRVAGNTLGAAGYSDPASLSPEQARDELIKLLPRLLGEGPDADAARDRAMAVIAAKANISPEEARTRVDQAVQQVRQQRDEIAAQARQAAEQARQAAAAGAMYAAIALAVGAVVGMLGGVWGSRRNA